MSLVESMMTECVLMRQDRVPDGEGGFTNSEWKDVGTFQAAIVHDNSTLARIAEKEGVTSTFTITTRRGVGLAFHDVFRRVSDDAVFRVSSFPDDRKSPAVSTINMEQCSAERWELTR